MGVIFWPYLMHIRCAKFQSHHYNITEDIRDFVIYLYTY